MSPLFWLIYPLTGALAGLLAGLFGLGGGLVMVPALLWIFDLQGFAPAHLMHLAVGTSLAAIVFTGTASAQAHLRRGAVDMRLAGWLTLGILLGAALGSVLAGRLEGRPCAPCSAAFSSWWQPSWHWNCGPGQR